MSPEELLRLAQQIGLRGLSITDHDTVGAYKTALPLAEKLGLKMISGIEFSAAHDNSSVHVLGYSFKLDSPSILELCEKHKTRRLERYRQMLELLKMHNMPITEEELLSLGQQGSIGRPHIAMAMMKKGYIGSIRDAFHNYLGEGKSCYVRSEYISVEETIQTIHDANGLAVIAHPHIIKNRKLINEILGLDFDGIEVHYAKFPADAEKPWADIAEGKKWIKTGGSDFHGSVKPENPLGCSWVNEQTFQQLYERFVS